MPDKTNKTDDFFNMLEQDQAVNDPFAAQEIPFRDASGNIKILKDGQVLDLIEDNKEDAKENTEEDINKPRPVVPVQDKVVKANPPADLVQVHPDIDEVVKESGIHFNDQLMERRFFNIVGSMLKGARNGVQTREAFIGSMESGGMGFDAKSADNILKIIKIKSSAHSDAIRDKMDSDLQNSLQQEMDELLKSPKTSPVKLKPSLTYTQDLIPKDETGPTMEEVKPSAKPVVKPPTSKPPVASPKPESISMPKPVTGPDPNKPKMEDIKFEPRLTGPIEEIKTMSLIDFRKLDPNPVQAVHKILDKINLLEEESFTLKTLGIKAWKESIINRQYVDLGEESMETKKPMAEIIAQKKATGQDVLTEEEIEAIIELNKLLRY